MAITLVTGQPGHGKTQWAIAQARKLLAEGRTVYAGNIKGLKYDAAGFQKLDRFEDWQTLPDGAVVLWDECYDALPQRASGKAVPAHVDGLARHRHRGFDFLLVCQQPKQLDGFLSGLVERHVHCRRRFGTSVVRLKEWDRWERDTERATPLVTKTWKLDRTIWPLYESATQHTVKVRVPWYVYALPLALLIVGGAVYGLPAVMLDKAATLEQQAQQQAAQGGTGGLLAHVTGGPQGNPSRLDRRDPAALLRPRVAGSPWTAPAYDAVEFGPPPRLACMASRDSCTCITIEQGTRWDVEPRVCRHIARHGRYDPTVRQQRPAQSRLRQPAT